MRLKKLQYPSSGWMVCSSVSGVLAGKATPRGSQVGLQGLCYAEFL